MAYPVLDKPYGLKPVNLIGGQVYAGSTRMIPIASGYATSMYNGDLVEIAAGGILNITGTTIPATSQAAQAARAGTIGVFLGCEYTPTGGPLFGKQRANWWQGGTVAQDAVGYVVDDPDALFKVAVLAQPAAATNTATAITTIGYVSEAFVGTNMYFIGAANGGVPATTAGVGGGNSLAGVSGNTAGAGNGAGNVIKTTANTAPFRVVQLVPDTAVTVSTALTAGASSTSLTVASTTGIQPGMQVVVPAYTAGAGNVGAYTYVTAVTSATAVTVSSSITAASGSQVSFIGYPEVIVKLNFGYHSYYNATSI